jgi:hypothetical protein
MELLLGHEQIITKSGISLNAGTLNRGFTVYMYILSNVTLYTYMQSNVTVVLVHNNHSFFLLLTLNWSYSNNCIKTQQLWWWWWRREDDRIYIRTILLY